MGAPLQAIQETHQTLQRQREEKARREAEQKEEDKRYGAMYVQEAQEALASEQEKRRAHFKKNQKYRQELMEHTKRCQDERKKKNASMTHLEKSLNGDVLQHITSDPHLFHALKQRVHKAGVK